MYKKITIAGIIATYVLISKPKFHNRLQTKIYNMYNRKIIKNLLNIFSNSFPRAFEYSSFGTHKSIIFGKKTNMKYNTNVKNGIKKMPSLFENPSGSPVIPQ
ncbi:MAG TPA: hypothetical protein PKU93_03620 [Candidatus Pacearchaeota archaeon]|nr:hypothetical protein [Candidatus Pacearchaeota archaeon]